MEKRTKEEELIKRLIVNNQIDFDKLPELSTKDRFVILRWLSKAKMTRSKSSKTEFGMAYSIQEIVDGKRVKVKCEDGVFTMPHYIIKFKE